MGLRITSSSVAWYRSLRTSAIARRLSFILGSIDVAIAGVALALGSWGLGGVFLVLSVAAIVAWVVGFVLASRRGPAGAPGEIAVEGDHLLVTHAEDVTRVPLAQLAQGWLERAQPRSVDDEDAQHEASVRLQLRSGTQLSARLRDRAEGEALLDAAHLSARERALRLPLLGAAVARPPGEALATLALVVLVPLAVVFGAGFFGLAAHAIAHGPVVVRDLVYTAALTLAPIVAIHRLIRFVGPGEVMVALDGVVVRRTWGHEIIPYDRIERVEAEARGVRLTLRGGGEKLLRTTDLRPFFIAAPLDAALAWRFPEPHDPVSMGRRDWTYENTISNWMGVIRTVAMRDALRDRIEQAMSLARGRAPSAAVMQELERRGRDASVWRDELRALLSDEAKDGSYRRVRIEPDQLFEVIEDGGAAPGLRVAAAVALSASPEGAGRVRAVAEASADEDLRAALVQAADGTIDEATLAAHDTDRARA